MPFRAHYEPYFRERDSEMGLPSFPRRFLRLPCSNQLLIQFRSVRMIPILIASAAQGRFQGPVENGRLVAENQSR